MLLMTLFLYQRKIRRGPKLEGCAFTNFGNSSGTEMNRACQKNREKNRQIFYRFREFCSVDIFHIKGGLCM